MTEVSVPDHNSFYGTTQWMLLYPAWSVFIHCPWLVDSPFPVFDWLFLLCGMVFPHIPRWHSSSPLPNHCSSITFFGTDNLNWPPTTIFSVSLTSFYLLLSNILYYFLNFVFLLQLECKFFRRVPFDLFCSLIFLQYLCFAWDRVSAQ